jgi:hypothetical protein
MQGAQINDKVIDPETGKPKTFSMLDVGKDAAIGGVINLAGGPLYSRQHSKRLQWSWVAS